MTGVAAIIAMETPLDARLVHRVQPLTLRNGAVVLGTQGCIGQAAIGLLHLA